MECEDDNNFTWRDNALKPIKNDDVNIPPCHDEVRDTIQQLKISEPAVHVCLLAELLKAVSDKLLGCMHHINNKIWLEESMPTNWNLNVLCSVKKKKKMGPNNFLYTLDRFALENFFPKLVLFNKKKKRKLL